MVEVSKWDSKTIIMIKNLDMYGGDITSKSCKSQEEALEMAKTDLKTGLICCTLAFNTLWVKNVQKTSPFSSNESIHNKCISFFLVNEAGAFIEDLDMMGGDIKTINVDTIADAKYEAKKLIEKPDLCATYDLLSKTLTLKLIRKTNPKASQNHTNCISYFYTECPLRED